MMASGIKVRLTALGLAVALMGALIIAGTLALQKMAEESGDRLSQVDLESFGMADQFRDRLRYANDKMRQFASTRDEAAWSEFVAASGEVGKWIGNQEPKLVTEKETAIAAQMRATLDSYLQRARDLRRLMAANASKGASLADYNRFFEGSRHFFDLGEELGRAHFDYRNEMLSKASRTLTQLRFAMIGFVALLFTFGLALAHGVYRDLIGPLQVKLVRSEAMAERNDKLASLGLLAAGVAHEIRNPLTAIKTALFIQQKKFDSASPAHRDGEVIEREILRLERIITEFLQFARPGRPQLAIIPADQPLEQVRALLSVQLAEAEIRLVHEPSAPLRVQVDPAQINQVLINLVQNAADAIGRSGTITLRSRSDRRTLRNGESDVVVLEVADTGKGIPPEVEKRLFDPFFTTKEKGTGLGLSIAARVVEMNGGALQYQTQVNKGSTFGIILPKVV